MPEVGYAFFCEDLRTEASGQTTAVGLWGERAYVGGFPAGLRSLAFHAYVSNRSRERVRFAVFIRGPFDPGEIRHDGEIALAGQHIGQNINLVIAPLLLTQPGTLLATLTIFTDPPIEKTITLEVLQRTTTPSRPPEPAPESSSS